MATEHRVLCINKRDRYNAYERIQSIGGINPGGVRWKLTQEEAIQGIENGKWSFYVHEAGERVDVIVAVSANGYKYLKTEADGEQPNNLLSLPECPA